MSISSGFFFFAVAVGGGGDATGGGGATGGGATAGGAAGERGAAVFACVSVCPSPRGRPAEALSLGAGVAVGYGAAGPAVTSTRDRVVAGAAGSGPPVEAGAGGGASAVTGAAAGVVGSSALRSVTRPRSVTTATTPANTMPSAAPTSTTRIPVCRATCVLPEPPVHAEPVCVDSLPPGEVMLPAPVEAEGRAPGEGSVVGAALAVGGTDGMWMLGPLDIGVPRLCGPLRVDGGGGATLGEVGRSTDERGGAPGVWNTGTATPCMRAMTSAELLALARPKGAIAAASSATFAKRSAGFFRMQRRIAASSSGGRSGRFALGGRRAPR